MTAPQQHGGIRRTRGERADAADARAAGALEAPASHAIVVTAPPAGAAESDTARGKKVRSEKAVRDTFSMPAAEHAQLKALRLALAQAGRLVTKSELLRAGLHLLAQRGARELAALVDALPPAAKGKRSKKH